MMMISPFSNASNLSKLSSNNAGRFNPTPTAAALPPAQDTLRFYGDLNALYLKLKEEAKLDPQKKADADFKEICDTVVMRKEGIEYKVVDVIAFMCRVRPEDDYDGQASIKELVEIFPSLDGSALEASFQKLVNHPNKYIHFRNDRTEEYWLTKNGNKMIEKLYPKGTLPPKKLRTILPSGLL